MSSTEGGGAEPRATSYRTLAWIATLAFCAISFAPRDGPAKYRWSFLFLVPIVWVVLALRRRLALLPGHFALFVLAMLLHDLGAFGWYQRSFFGLRYDWYVHYFFGLVGGLIVARLLQVRLGLRGPALGLLVVLAVTGIGGLHEIMEAASSILLGAEYGMLRVGADNPYDTQFDLLNNVLGAGTALVLRALGARRQDLPPGGLAG